MHYNFRTLLRVINIGKSSIHTESSTSPLENTNAKNANKNIVEVSRSSRTTHRERPRCHRGSTRIDSDARKYDTNLDLKQPTVSNTSSTPKSQRLSECAVPATTPKAIHSSKRKNSRTANHPVWNTHVVPLSSPAPMKSIRSNKRRGSRYKSSDRIQTGLDEKNSTSQYSQHYPSRYNVDVHLKCCHTDIGKSSCPLKQSSYQRTKSDQTWSMERAVILPDKMQSWHGVPDEKLNYTPPAAHAPHKRQAPEQIKTPAARYAQTNATNIHLNSQPHHHSDTTQRRYVPALSRSKSVGHNSEYDRTIHKKNSMV